MLPVEELKKEQFSKSGNRKTFDSSIKSVWVRLTLTNEANKTKELYLHNSARYFYRFITVYEYNGDTLHNKRSYDIAHKKSEEVLSGSDSIYEFTLHPTQTKTLYIHKATHITILNIYSLILITLSMN